MEDPRADSFDGIAEGRAPAEHRTQTQEEMRLVEAIKEKFRRCYEHRHPYASDWEFFRAYVKGDQLVVRHRETGDVIRLTAKDSRKLRSVNNYLRPTARSLIGKLTRAIPTVEVVPATSDVDEQHAARAANNYVQYFRNKEKLDKKYREACDYLPWAGNAIQELEWDPLAGDDIANCPVCDFYHEDTEMVGSQCPKCMMQREQEVAAYDMEIEQWKAQQFMAILPHMPEDVVPSEDMLPWEEAPQPQQLGDLPTDQPVPNLVESKEGDLVVKVRDISDVYIEPGVESLEEATYYFTRVSMPTVRARQMFPEAAHWITDDDDVYTDEGAETHDRFFDLYTEYEPEAEFCRVYKYVEIPTSKYPEGRVVYIVNDQIAREVPYTTYKLLGRFAIFHFGFDRNPGEFWHEPPLAHAWHRQREINENETSIREHVTLLLKPKLLNPIGSKISSDEFSATTAQSISYNRAAGEPTWQQVPRVPPDVFNRSEILKDDIRTHFGITPHELGQVPADPNGRAMAILEAEADQMLGPVIKQNNDEWKELHRCILLMAQKFVPESKMFSLVGPDGHQTFSFRDVKLLNKGWDLYLEEDDGLAKNQAVRLTQAMDLMNAGVFMDPATGLPDTKKFSRYAKLKMPGSQDPEASERARASELPYLFERGQPWTPMPFDVPHIWKDELEIWLRGPGRRADPYVLQEVMAAWQFYTMWAVAGILPPGIMQPQAGRPPPMPSQPGQDMTAPGGTPNNPGHLGTGTESAQVETTADRGAEAHARVQQKHEG